MLLFSVFPSWLTLKIYLGCPWYQQKSLRKHLWNQPKVGLATIWLEYPRTFIRNIYAIKGVLQNYPTMVNCLIFWDSNSDHLITRRFNHIPLHLAPPSTTHVIMVYFCQNKNQRSKKGTFPSIHSQLLASVWWLTSWSSSHEYLSFVVLSSRLVPEWVLKVEKAKGRRKKDLFFFLILGLEIHSWSWFTVIVVYYELFLLLIHRRFLSSYICFI